MSDWRPAIGERFIYKDDAVLFCADRVLHPNTRRRCLIGRNVNNSGYLDKQLLDFEDCRQYWEPQPGDRVKVITRLSTFGKTATVLGWVVDLDGLRLVRLRFDDGTRKDYQHIWLEPELDDVGRAKAEAQKLFTASVVDLGVDL